MVTDILDQTKNLLQKSGLKPKDYMGQNFLIDEQVLREIVAAADLKSQDTVLEVGPGLGILTKELLKESQKVLAIEKDQNLYRLLKNYFKHTKNLELINDDVLKFHLGQNIQSDYKVVANIPYYLTSKLFQYFLEQSNKPKLMILMVQKEVGERVVATAGDLSILGISVQIFADVSIVANVNKNSFWPIPKVDSVILKIVPRLKYPKINNQKLFFWLIKVGFAGKRKQIHNTLTNGLKLPKAEILEALRLAGIESTLRPQDLTIEQWIALYEVIGERI